MWQCRLLLFGEGHNLFPYPVMVEFRTWFTADPCFKFHTQNFQASSEHLAWSYLASTFQVWAHAPHLPSTLAPLGQVRRAALQATLPFLWRQGKAQAGFQYRSSSSSFPVLYFIGICWIQVQIPFQEPQEVHAKTQNVQRFWYLWRRWFGTFHWFHQSEVHNLRLVQCEVIKMVLGSNYPRFYYEIWRTSPPSM